MDDARKEALQSLNAYIAGIMILGKQICRYIEELTASISLEDCIERWERIAPTGNSDVDALVKKFISDVSKEMTRQ